MEAQLQVLCKWGDCKKRDRGSETNLHILVPHSLSIITGIKARDKANKCTQEPDHIWSKGVHHLPLWMNYSKDYICYSQTYSYSWVFLYLPLISPATFCSTSVLFHSEFSTFSTISLASLWLSIAEVWMQSFWYKALGMKLLGIFPSYPTIHHVIKRATLQDTLVQPVS